MKDAVEEDAGGGADGACSAALLPQEEQDEAAQRVDYTRDIIITQHQITKYLYSNQQLAGPPHSSLANQALDYPAPTI